MKKLFIPFLLFSLLSASDVAEYHIVFSNDGVHPEIINVGARKRFRLIIENKSESPIEFEIKNPIKELVLAPGKKGTVGMRPLSPGEYEFFNDFDPSSKTGKIIVK